MFTCGGARVRTGAGFGGSAGGRGAPHRVKVPREEAVQRVRQRVVQTVSCGAACGRMSGEGSARAAQRNLGGCTENGARASPCISDGSFMNAGASSTCAIRMTLDA